VSEAALAQIQEALARVLSPREKRALVVRREAWRTYPRGAFLGAVVGVTDAAPAGVEGIEKSMDLFLSPRDGQREFLVDASRRNQIFTLGNQYLAPVESYDVRLTIDSRVQAIVEEELSRGLEHEKADAGLLIVMDPRSGDVLAMASQPTYDPGRFAEYPQEELARRRKNAAVEKLYEPGSIIKPFIAACALERGLCRRDQLVRELASPVVSWDGGKVARFGQRVVRDVHEHSGMTVEDAVVHSSNIGMSILGLKLGREGLIDVLERFAFCRETGIELPAEAKGKYTQPEKWRPLTTSVSVSFGYEVMVSPIQLCRAFAALVNGGTLLRPRLVDRVFRGEEAHAGEPRQEVGRAITAETSKQMREVLRGVVERGTARWLRLEGFPFGGKTGTAVMQHGGAYRRGEYVASFEAFAPYDEPQVVILCMLEKPRGGSYYGSMVAGPIVVEVIRRLFHVAAKPEVPRI
jgi:cell division protein FtsI/penicillin-binding protein 2